MIARGLEVLGNACSHILPTIIAGMTGLHISTAMLRELPCVLFTAPSRQTTDRPPARGGFFTRQTACLAAGVSGSALSDSPAGIGIHDRSGILLSSLMRVSDYE